MNAGKELAGRRALVCGASRGIGRAVAGELAARGAEILLLARDAAALEQVKSALTTGEGRGHRAVVADMSDTGRLREQVAALVADTGPIHVLVHNSGGPPPGPLVEADPESFAAAFVQHVVAGQVLVQALLPGMKDAGYGRIVQIISTSVKQPLPGLGVSNTIRGAVASWAKTLAGEVARFGITVNNVLPGATRTERLESLIRARADREGRTPAEVETAMQAAIPAGRFANPEEIARAVAFLASPGAAYITGINLPVDGGRTGSL
jgi:3-oxoacyl-[acyl-carrier protein] reductase